MCKVGFQAAHIHMGFLRGCTGAKGCAQVGNLVGQLLRATGGGALLQHGGGEAGQAGLAQGVGQLAGTQRQAGADQG